MYKQSQDPQDWTPETQLRVAEVADKILIAWRRIDICKKYSEDWNVSFRTVDEYIMMAKAQIREVGPQIPIEEMIAERIAEYEKLYRLTLADNQYAVAKSILKDKSELEKLLIQKVDITSNGKPLNMVNIIVKSEQEKKDLEENI